MGIVDEHPSSINNRFKLVVLASQRAHDLSSGAHPTIDDKKSKNTVIALQEIASGRLNNKALFDFAVKRCRAYIDELFDLDSSFKYGNKVNSLSDSSYSNEVKDLGDLSTVKYSDDLTFASDADESDVDESDVDESDADVDESDADESELINFSGHDIDSNP